MAEERQVVKSYHTFAFPFIWEQGGLSLADMADSFKQSKYWSCDDFTNKWELPKGRATAQNELSLLDSEGEDSAEKQETQEAAEEGKRQKKQADERSLLYAEYQYFYPAVRNTLYGMGDSPTSHRFSFRPSGREDTYNRNSGMEYVIECDAWNYRLNLNGIRLRLYNTGVGILVFECENSTYSTLEDVKAINEYGRRVGVAAVPTFANAKRLSVRFEDGAEFMTGFGFQPEDIGKALSLTYFADFITKLLNLGNEKYQFVSHQTEKDEEVFIYPAIDDRMFTHCVVALSEADSGELFEYFDDPATADTKVEKSLYELFYVDREGDCSAQETGMRRRELENSAYLRWLDYGTLHAVTHHSMFMIAKTPPDHLVNTFLTEYFELSCLCLAQKASLISLQKKMTEISSGLEVDGKRMNSDKVNRLADLQERFVAFSNQLDFYSVTEQYQGVELYNMLREQLYIKEARDSLHDQIESLYETANVNQDVSFNKWALVLALIALFWEAASTWTDSVAVFQSFADGDFLALVVTLVIAAALVGLAFGITFGLVRRTTPRNRKNKKG